GGEGEVEPAPREVAQSDLWACLQLAAPAVPPAAIMRELLALEGQRQRVVGVAEEILLALAEVGQRPAERASKRIAVAAGDDAQHRRRERAGREPALAARQDQQRQTAAHGMAELDPRLRQPAFEVI